ncbi:hypothetical protein OGAPHI_001444 [Ogataea philodendri]|uniref:Vacuolar protein sorting-associated protein 51 homolog n=1 Tax=Ogataea philodendri TaxID=1378263 RepID=A0A9P8PBQ1_9ASCO|nr:uncharacterized protein OGAPHI_001444 [Ogataea philodendri]KAH3669323.1 hypothetical protein OGAPHI_001444 [Ogataea philodendri]
MSASSRRKALKDFYKLQEQTQQQLQNSQTLPVEEPKPEAELSVDNIDEFIRDSDFVKILETENKVTEELNTNQAEIKSIIYNNYYELIKINDVLMDLKLKNTQEDGVMENLEKIRKNIKTLRKDNYELLSEPLDKKDSKISKTINKLLLDNKNDKKTIDAIDNALPKLHGESLLLQLNELKSK